MREEAGHGEEPRAVRAGRPEGLGFRFLCVPPFGGREAPVLGVGAPLL